MRTPATASTWTPTRRAFLQALRLSCATRLRPIVLRLTALADDFDWLMRWCSCTAGPRFADG